MLTLKQITEQTDAVIAGLKKKHFKNAEEAIAQAIKLNDDRKKAQAQLDNNLAEGKTLAAKIGQAMKAGNKDEAEQAKAKVAELKVAAAELEAKKEPWHSCAPVSSSLSRSSTLCSRARWPRSFRRLSTLVSPKWWVGRPQDRPSGSC